MADENVVEKLVVQLIGDLSDLSTKGDEAQEILIRITNRQEELEQAIGTTTSTIEDNASTVQKNTQEVDSFSDATELVNHLLSESSRILEELAQGNKDLQNSVSDASTATENQAESQTQANDTFANARKLLSQAQESAREVSQEYNRMADELDRVEKRNASLRNLAAGLGRLPGPAGRVAREVQNIADSAQTFVGASGNMLPAVIAIGAGLTAILGPAAAVYLAYRKLSNEMENLDRVAKKAEAMGDSVGSLQSLSFALKEIAGMSEGQVESALTRLQRAVGGAAEGAGEGSKAFQKLGLDVNALNKMAPTEQFRAVAEAIQSYGSHAEKARVAQQLFGRGSQEILLALTAEKEAFEESEKWAEKYGLTISSIESESIQRANDAIGRVGDALAGWTTQLAAEFAPLFEVIANHILAWIPPATEFQDAIRFVVDLSTVMLGILTDVGKVIAGAAKILMGDFSEGFEMMKEGFSAESAAKFLYESEQARKEAEKTAIEKERQKKTQQEINRELERQNQIEERAQGYVADLKKQYEFMSQEETGESNRKLFEMQQQGVDPEILNEAKEFERKIAEIEEKRKKNKEELASLEQEAAQRAQEQESFVKRGLALDEQYKTEQEKILDKAQELKDLFDQGLIKPETFERGLEDLNSGLTQATEEANRFWEAMNGPQMSEFGSGREGLEESLINLRGEARANLLESEGADPELAKFEGMRAAREEGSSRKSETEKKLVSVLSLLEQRLSKTEDPNTLKLQVIDSLN
jgi:hypothetical protein